VRSIGNEMAVLNEEELTILQAIQKEEFPPATDAYIGLKAHNIILEYSDTKTNIINPILECNVVYKQRLESI